MKLPPTIKQTFYVLSGDESKYSGSSETEAQTVYAQCIANGVFAGSLSNLITSIDITSLDIF